MRKILLLFAILLSLNSFAQEESRFDAFDSLLEEFYQSLITEDTQTKLNEMNTLIDSSTDSLFRQHIALKIFDHYRYSKVMGEEAVAVYLFDKWFKDETIKMRSEFDYIDSQLFADFNRHSLIGMTAPQIKLYKPSCGTMTIPRNKNKAVIFFYDTSCAKCRIESQILPTVLNDLDFDLDFYAVYAGSDKNEWKDFIKNFKFKNKHIKVFNLWDPEMKSEYQRYYSVLGTPRMYFVLENGEIIGRRLEVENLKEIITYIQLINGSQE